MSDHLQSEASATTDTKPGSSAWQTVALLCLIALAAYCIAWEIYLAPIGKGLLAIKALPLFLALRGISAGRVYTFQWTSMLALAYIAEGLVRGTSDPLNVRIYGWVEVGLATGLFVACLAYAYPYKRAAKLRKALAEQSTHSKVAASSTDQNVSN